MDVLVARKPTGNTHAITCDHPPGFGERFVKNMEVQGLIVTRYSGREYRKLQQAGIEENRQRRAAQQAATSQAAPQPPVNEAPTLPSVGQEVMHDLIGWSKVTHTITLDGTVIPVVVGPRGSGMVKPDQWKPAVHADRPYWMKDDVSPKPPVERQVPETCPTVEHGPPVMPAPAPTSQAEAATPQPAFKPGDWIRQHPGGKPHITGSKGTFTLCGLGIRSSAVPMGELGKFEDQCSFCKKNAYWIDDWRREGKL